MSEILFLAHRVPFPPDRGDKIRSHHVLARLAELAPVHVAAFGETDRDMAQQGALAALAASHRLLRRDKPLWRAGLKAIARREPVSLAAFRNAELAGWVRETLAARPISTIYVFSGQMGQYVPADFAGRVVLDLVDVDSAKFEAYARAAPFPLGRFHAREARLLAREEARLAARANVTLLVSDDEAALFRERCGAGPDVRTLGIGIDADLFDPAEVVSHPDLAEGGPHLVFTGQMDYPPNVAAARRAATRLLPAIRAVHPQAQLHIVGRAPTPALRRLDSRGGVRVWGAVPEMKPFLAGADVVLAPLEIARGLQTKMLEAMAMARPIVATSGAATGIAAENARHLAIVDTDRGLVSAALALLENPDKAAAMGRAARAFVIERHRWDAVLGDLPALVGFDRKRSARDAA